MNLEDSKAIDWMLNFKRNPFPNHVVWHQNGDKRKSLYWIFAEKDLKDETIIRSEIKG